MVLSTHRDVSLSLVLKLYLEKLLLFLQWQIEGWAEGQAEYIVYPYANWGK